MSDTTTPPDLPKKPPKEFKLRASQNMSLPAKHCPTCNTACDANSGVCVACGYNFNTQTMATPNPSTGSTGNQLTMIRWLLTGILLTGLAIAVAVFTQILKKDGGTTGQKGATEAMLTEETTTAQPITESATTPQPVAAEEPAPAPPQEDEVRAQIIQELGDNFPLYKIGQVANIRTRGGIVHTGNFSAHRGDTISIVENRKYFTFEMEKLDRDTRIRFDKDYRQRYIEHLVKKALGN